jgi:hypothetical protein
MFGNISCLIQNVLNALCLGDKKWQRYISRVVEQHETIYFLVYNNEKTKIGIENRISHHSQVCLL